jgi:predicted DNA-binding protein
MNNYTGGVSMTGKKQSGARMPDEMWEQLRKLAARNGRTLSAELEIAVGRHLDGKGEELFTSEEIKALKDLIKRTANGSR